MFVKHMAPTFRGELVCCLLYVYRLKLFSLTARRSLRTVLISMKPEVHCTSVASTVSLFIGIENGQSLSQLSQSTTDMASDTNYTSSSKASK